METKLFLLLITSVLYGCHNSSQIKDLKTAITEIEKHSEIDTIRFNDSLLVRKYIDDKRLYLYNEKIELGLIFKGNNYKKIYPDKMNNIPKLTEQDYIFGYGETKFSYSCITCHDPQKIRLQEWDHIEKKEKPTILYLNNSEYYFVKNNSFHWNFIFMDDYEKNALKQYLKR